MVRYISIALVSTFLTAHAQPPPEPKKPAAKKVGKDADKPAPEKPAEAAPPAKVAPESVTVTPFELARGRFEKGKVVPPKLATCDITTGDDGATFDRTKCKLAALTKATTTEEQVEVRIAAGEPLPARVVRRAASMKIETSTPLDSIAILAPGGWREITLANGETGESIELTGAVYGLGASGKLYALALAPPRIVGQPGCVEEDAAWCKAANDDDVLICIDAVKGFAPATFQPKKHVLAPNTSVSLVVRHLTSHGAVLKQLGTRGLFEASVSNYTGKTVAPENLHQDEGAACATTTHGSFAPRVPGSADIKIELRDVSDKAKLVAEHTVELEVVTNYVGAIRFGISTLMGRAVDRGYESQLAPGSATREIAVSESGDVNPELVVGVSAYLCDIIASGGRVYVHRPGWSYLCPSPYIGVGIVTSKNDELEHVPSVHLGLEWEISKSFAVSLDAVARKVTRLADGFAVGSPVSAMTKFTNERYEWGWAITMSVSPEFFQLATGGKP